MLPLILGAARAAAPWILSAIGGMLPSIVEAFSKKTPDEAAKTVKPKYDELIQRMVGGGMSPDQAEKTASELIKPELEKAQQGDQMSPVLSALLMAGGAGAGWKFGKALGKLGATKVIDAELMGPAEEVLKLGYRKPPTPRGNNKAVNETPRGQSGAMNDQPALQNLECSPSGTLDDATVNPAMSPRNFDALLRRPQRPPQASMTRENVAMPMDELPAEARDFSMVPEKGRLLGYNGDMLDQVMEALGMPGKAQREYRMSLLPKESQGY